MNPSFLVGRFSVQRQNITGSRKLGQVICQTRSRRSAVLHICKPTWFTSSFAPANEPAESGSEKNTNGDLKGSIFSLQPLPLLFTALLQCEDGGQFFAMLAHKTADWLVVLRNTLTVGLRMIVLEEYLSCFCTGVNAV
ncbi:unnamed protein product [Sphagnum jensenii]|uniref:Uncharacterized protein n=1 Tax=Sphagnum jensenii TaxID=128206 RepID=A0ABP1BI98_9BRYO